MNNKVLIVDDEQSICEFFKILFKKLSLEIGHSFELTVIDNGAKALELIQRKHFDMVVSDLKLPDLSGLKLLQRTKSLYPDIIFLMITAFDTTETAVKAMKMGAYDYIPKPFNVTHIKKIITTALNPEKNFNESGDIPSSNPMHRKDIFSLVGQSEAIKKIQKTIKQISSSSAYVLITGDSGTGKEMIARSIHQHSPLKNNMFVAVNCGAIPDSLIESEMFGHKKGSFTGAVSDKKGFFESANGGTLFLDEIGELPLALQPKLLRVLQEKVVRMVGAVEDKKIEVRLISATNRNLTEMVREGRFREDLFYRLNVVHIHIPSLKERKDDIPLLVKHFFKQYSVRQNLPVPELSDEVMQVFQEYDYPGNVRELENLIERILILREKEQIFPEELRSFLKKTRVVNPNTQEELLKFSLPEKGMDMEKEIGDLEKSLLVQALERSKGVKKGAADLLGLSLRSFRYRLQKHNLDIDEDSE